MARKNLRIPQGEKRRQAIAKFVESVVKSVTKKRRTK